MEMLQHNVDFPVHSLYNAQNKQLSKWFSIQTDNLCVGGVLEIL